VAVVVGGVAWEAGLPKFSAGATPDELGLLLEGTAGDAWFAEDVDEVAGGA
jgi:hypothetical protein